MKKTKQNKTKQTNKQTNKKKKPHLIEKYIPLCNVILQFFILSYSIYLFILFCFILFSFHFIENFGAFHSS